METIKNYLETMFANMPNTEAVKKAKQELLQMMEDKYTELIAEGKSENEAVGTVISEFGNLEELSEDLGLKEEYKEEQRYSANNTRRNITFEEAKAYIIDCKKHATMVAIGVLLCIICVNGPILSEGLKLNDMIGVTFMFLAIAVAVFLFVFSSIIYRSKWSFVKQQLCSIDYNTANYLHNELETRRVNFALFRTIGIVMCVVCWLPCAIFSDVADHASVDSFAYLMSETISPMLLFLMIGFGVLFIVKSNLEQKSYNTLLKINDRNTMSGYYVPEQKEEYINDEITTIMSLFWPTVTCAYLIWSFLSFDWYITWIIWPIAAIIHAVIKTNLKK